MEHAQDRLRDLPEVMSMIASLLDRNSIYSFRLTSRTNHDICQPFFYREVRLDDRWTNDSLKKLAKYAKVIRTLHVRDGDKSIQRYYSAMSTCSVTPPSKYMSTCRHQPQCPEPQPDGPAQPSSSPSSLTTRWTHFATSHVSPPSSCTPSASALASPFSIWARSSSTRRSIQTCSQGSSRRSVLYSHWPWRYIQIFFAAIPSSQLSFTTFRPSSSPSPSYWPIMKMNCRPRPGYTRMST